MQTCLMWRVLCAGGAGIGFAARATIGVSQGAARTGRRARVPVVARGTFDFF